MSILQASDGDRHGLDWLRDHCKPAARFADYHAHIHLKRTQRQKLNGTLQELLVLYDHDKVIGIWNQGKRPWERRFHLVTTFPGKGLTQEQLHTLLERHWTTWGYDALWSPGGMLFSVGPWYPNAEQVVDKVTVSPGKAGPVFTCREQTVVQLAAAPAKTALNTANLTVWVDPVHGYRLRNDITVVCQDLTGIPKRLSQRIMPFTPTVGGVQHVWNQRSTHDRTVFTPANSIASDGQVKELQGYAHNAGALRRSSASIDSRGFIAMLAAEHAVDRHWSMAVTSDRAWGYGHCPLMIEITNSSQLTPFITETALHYQQRFDLYALPPAMTDWLKERAQLRPGQHAKAIMLPIGRLENFSSQPWSTQTTARGVLIAPATIKATSGLAGSPCLSISKSVRIATSPHYPPIRLEPNSSYELRCWAKCTTPDTSAQILAKPKAWHMPPGTTPSTGQSTTIASQWQQVRMTIQTTAADLATELQLHFIITGGGSLLIDDFLLQRKP